MKISEEARDKAKRVDDVCKSYFQTENDLMSKCRDEQTCLARSFSWHILHEEMKLSVKTIALIYHRCIRNVQYTLAKMRFLTQAVKDYDTQKRDLMERLAL